MKKGSFWDDTFEKAVEAGRVMTKSGVKQLKQTFSPLQMIKNAAGISSAENGNPRVTSDAENQMKEAVGKNPNNTPLDFAKLQDKFADKDKTATDALRQRLFQMVKSGDEKIFIEKKQKEQEKKQQEMYDVHEKQRRQQEQQQIAAQAGEPQGKERTSVLGSKKKKAKTLPSQAELKPGNSKQ